MCPSLLYIFVWVSVIWLQSLQLLNSYHAVNIEFVEIQFFSFIVLLISETVIKKNILTITWV